ncbi:hypothetical protein MJT46_007450 [Ovis ammon polii x Ovis aries]|nr:hypothetical protein MJT46_007450 [Ovis ammon polii x Ovis aries]
MSRAGMTQEQLFPSGEAQRQRCQGVWPGFFFGAGVCVQTRVPAAPWGNSGVSRVAGAAHCVPAASHPPLNDPWRPRRMSRGAERRRGSRSVTADRPLLPSPTGPHRACSPAPPHRQLCTLERTRVQARQGQQGRSCTPPRPSADAGA